MRPRVSCRYICVIQMQLKKPQSGYEGEGGKNKGKKKEWSQKDLSTEIIPDHSPINTILLFLRIYSTPWSVTLFIYIKAPLRRHFSFVLLYKWKRRGFWERSTFSKTTYLIKEEVDCGPKIASKFISDLL